MTLSLSVHVCLFVCTSVYMSLYICLSFRVFSLYLFLFYGSVTLKMYFLRDLVTPEMYEEEADSKEEETQSGVADPTHLSQDSEAGLYSLD